MLRKVFNYTLDKIVNAEVCIRQNGTLSSFKFFGYTGLVLATITTMTMVIYISLPPRIMIAIILEAILIFLGLAMVTKIIKGVEKLVYYHHEIAVIAATAVFLRILNQPVLPYLDVTILGIGIFLVCGRVGCLMVGCCHGRPNKWGVCYRQEHADAGFTPYYVGVRLFPIQAVESIWVLLLVIVGTILVLGKCPAGEALAWYVVAYGIGRFCFEFMRGDPDRPYRLGFSEAQWTSIILMGAVVWGELAGVLAFHLWHIVATGGIALTMVAVGLSRRLRRTTKHQLLHPRHVKEVAEVVGLVTCPAGGREAVSRSRSWNSGDAAIEVGCTSLGIQISAGKINNRETYIDHYALSSQNGSMTEEGARILADLIKRLKHPSGSDEFIMGNRNVFHLLVHPLIPGSQP